MQRQNSQVRAGNYSRKLQHLKVADGGRVGLRTLANEKMVVCDFIPSVHKGGQRNRTSLCSTAQGGEVCRKYIQLLGSL
jgi:hypothetical protein